jgi:hypothetical protein
MHLAVTILVHLTMSVYALFIFLRGLSLALIAAHAIISLYEAAAPAAPSEDFLASMFVAYARVGHHVKMQQTAMRLAKATRNDKYLAWAAVNMAFQVCGGRVGGDRGRMKKECLIVMVICVLVWNLN